MVEASANHIESITLFEDPLPDLKDSQVILDKVRRSAELRYGTDFQGDVVAVQPMASLISSFYLVSYVRVLCSSLEAYMHR